MDSKSSTCNLASAPRSAPAGPAPTAADRLDLFGPQPIERNALTPRTDPKGASDVRKALLSTPEERANSVLGATIRTPDVQRFDITVDHLIQRATETSIPGGLIVVGEGGLGKSFMLKRVLNRYPKSWTLGRTISPAVRVSLTDGMKPSDLERAILKELGDIAERKAPDPSRRQLVVNSLRECGSRVLLLDEAQKLALVKGARSDDRAAGPLGDYLKDLYDTACIAIVMAGTKSLQAVVKQDPQLRTRWGGEILLERYTIDDDQWKSLLLALSRVLPMPESTDLLPASTALLTASSGNLRQLKVLVSEAVRLASREGAMCLKVQHLAKAYAVLSFPVPTPFK